MKFLRTFLCNTEDEITAVRKHIPDAPVFYSCVLHGSDAAPQRIDLYTTARPHEDGVQPFCVYLRNEEGALVTDYVATEQLPTAVKRKGKAKRPKGYVEQTLADMLPVEVAQ